MFLRTTMNFGWIFLMTTGAFAQEPAPTVLPTPAAETVHIDGILFERGTRKPLADANVYILPHNIKVTADAKGHFSADAVPVGPFEWVVNVTGYDRLDQKDEARHADTRIRRLFVQKIRYEGVFETTIVGKKEKRDETQRSMTSDQFLTVPGAGGDPIKAVQNLPGINRSPGFLSNVIIQGSDLQSTQYLVDGHEVPLIFHFAGLSTVVFPEAIESVDYLSAGYGPEYGRVLGGLVGVKIREPRRDRWRGLAFADLINAGGLVEGGLTKNSGLMVSVRQSYIGEVLNAVVGDRKDFNFTVAPRFMDGTLIYDLTSSEHTKFRVSSVASMDAVEFLLKNPVNADPGLRGNFRNSTKFFRLIPQLSVDHGEGWESRYSVGIGWTGFKIETDQDVLDLRFWSFTPKVEVRAPILSTWTAYVGTDSQLTYVTANVDLPTGYQAGGVFNPFSSGTRVAVRESKWFYQPSLYMRNVFHWEGSPWTFLPSARFDYYNSTDQALIDPRSSVTYDVNESLRLKASGGRYHQVPQARETDSVFGNPNLKTPSAWHLMVGADKDFRHGSTQGFTMSTDGFFRWFDNLVVPSNQAIVVNGVSRPEFFSNSSSGTSFGGETSVKYDFDPWGATLSYTLLRSRRTEPGIGTYPAQFDQTHNVNLLVGVNLPRNWRMTTRVRYVTGNPYTPIVGGIFDSNDNVFIPERGAYYSQRLDPFFQCDVRVDKKWVYDTWMLTLYLDLQNVTNRSNVEGVRYSYDYTKFATISGLPLLPSFGLKGEF